MTHVVNTGYELHADSEFTVGSPMALVSGVAKKLTIDGLGALQDVSQHVGGMTPLWDPATDIMKHYFVGQLFGYRLTFTITPSGAEKRVTVQVKDAPNGAVVLEDTIQLVKGGATAQTVSRYYPIYADATSVANGMEIYLTCNDSATVHSATLLVMSEHIPHFGA